MICFAPEIHCLDGAIKIKLERIYQSSYTGKCVRALAQISCRGLMWWRKTDYNYEWTACILFKNNNMTLTGELFADLVKMLSYKIALQ